MSLQSIHVVALIMLLPIASVFVEAKNRDHWVQLTNKWSQIVRLYTSNQRKSIVLSYVMPLIVPRIIIMKVILGNTGSNLAYLVASGWSGSGHPVSGQTVLFGILNTEVFI